jgi:hypothetical protein
MLKSCLPMSSLQPRIFIQQASKKTKSASSIIGSLAVSVEELRSYLTSDEYGYLRALKLTTVVMRATDTSSDGRNAKTWAEMEVGDIALIAWRGHIEAAGEIVMRKDSKALGIFRLQDDRYHLWYFLRNVVDRLQIPYGRINQVLGYEKGNSFQRFRGLDERGSGAVVELLRDS